VKIWTGVVFEPFESLVQLVSREADLARPNTVTYDPPGVAAVPTRATAQIQTKAKSKGECVAWLCEVMRASPTERTHSKAALWKLAQQKWPGTLAGRAFLDAREQAIQETRAFAWGAAGAPGKSKRP
jgi:hypothetical protein